MDQPSLCARILDNENALLTFESQTLHFRTNAASLFHFLCFDLVTIASFHGVTLDPIIAFSIDTNNNVIAPNNA